MSAEACGPPLIEVSGVRREYAGGRRSGAVVALDGVSLGVARGEFLALLGPNGSGKSTLLRLLCTLDTPGAGTVRLFGEDPARNPRAVRARIGVLFQHPAIDPLLTVRENLMTQASLYGVRSARERVEACAREMEIEDRLDERAGRLSGGLVRRADLARALVHEPELLLLDEPTTGLDPSARARFMETVSALVRERGMTVVMSTHLMDEAERAGRVAMLSGGRVVASGTRAALCAELGGAFVVETDGAFGDVLASQGAEVCARGGVVRAFVDEASARALSTRLIDSGASVRVGPPGLGDVYERLAGEPLGDGEGGER